MSNARRHLGFLAVTLLVIFVAGRIYRATRPTSPEDALEPLKEELALLRSAADSCTRRYGIVEARFRGHESRVDSLRDEVRRYEALSPSGVPGTEYPEYLEVFDAYNEALPEWEARADSVRVQFERCRSLTTQHNALADSLRAQLVEIGLWPREAAPVGQPEG